MRHPGIAQVYELGEHDGLPFFAMEFCPGGSLADTLAGTPLPPRGAAGLAARLAAHQAEFVRDNPQMPWVKATIAVPQPQRVVYRVRSGDCADPEAEFAEFLPHARRGRSRRSGTTWRARRPHAGIGVSAAAARGTLPSSPTGSPQSPTPTCPHTCNRWTRGRAS